MNLKKFKKSLVSIVLGSSLSLGNGGVVCQQPKAWFYNEFIDSETEKYAHNPEMTKIIKVLKFFSDLYKKPEYAGALRFIYTSSLLRLKDLAEVRESAGSTESFQVLFTNAIVVAIFKGPAIGTMFKNTDGTHVFKATEELLELLCLCSECTIDPVTKILQEELELIFSGQQINDPIVVVGEPASSCSFYNSELDIQLKNLLTSAIELLSE